MVAKNKGLAEKQLDRALYKAVKEFLRELEKEPSIIIESADETTEHEQQIDEILSWLFRRR